jgi:restriction endonuclease Mrr
VEILLPNSAALNSALLTVLREHPGGLNSKEIDRLASEKLGISETDLGVIRSGTRTEFAYRMAWERTHAKAKGFIGKNEFRVWFITDSGKLIK